MKGKSRVPRPAQRSAASVQGAAFLPQHAASGGCQLPARVQHPVHTGDPYDCFLVLSCLRAANQQIIVKR